MSRIPSRVISERLRTNGKFESFPEDLPPIHFTMIQAELKQTAKLAAASTWLSFDTYRPQIGRLVPEKAYKMPIPLQVQDTSKTGFNDGYSYLNSVVTASQQAASGLLGQTGGDRARAFGQAAATAAGTGLAASGFAVNTMRGVTLEQPQFKTHQLSWKFSPKSEEESYTAQRFIHSLKSAAAIRYALGSTVNTGPLGKAAASYTNAVQKALFAYPRIFIPYFSNTKMMYKFKPCVISNIAVDYGGGNAGPSFYHKTDAPESLTLQITLLELEFWTNDDFKADTDATGLPTNEPHNAFGWYTMDDSGAPDTPNR